MIALLILCHLAGLIMAVLSLFQARTPQGALAWFISLLMIPYAAIPLFIAFGKRGIKKYSRINMKALYPELNYPEVESHYRRDLNSPLARLIAKTEHPLTQGHAITLLDGTDKVFKEMLKSIREATSHVLVQMYIFRMDKVGEEFAAALSQKARKGVKVYLMFDNFIILSDSAILRELRNSGVKFTDYNYGRRGTNHLNFRNHRKLVLIDGDTAYIGGANIGEEYIGLDPEIGHWRDTNLKFSGPGVILAQAGFAKDWYWATGERPLLNWEVPAAKGKSSVIYLASDPSEENALNLLQHMEFINLSQRRLWIANPYLVPPQGLLDAIIMASIRGVDVRLLIPGVNDNLLVAHAGKVYYERLLKNGVRVYRYTPGMMHQKVMLVDETCAMVGSSNLDFRSMYINFENGLVTDDEAMIRSIHKMFERDFGHSEELGLDEFLFASFADQLKARVSNLLAPIL